MEDRRRCFYGILLIYFMARTSTEPRKQQMNVLFIVSDDLRPALGSYGYEIVQTPNLDKLAERSVRFTTAASQMAVCAPSRTSFLTGRRPDTTKLFSNKKATYWRENAGNFTTLPQHFKNAGYVTVSVGKIFHGGKASNFTYDYPYSWSIRPYLPSSQKFKNAKVCPGLDGKLYTNIVCPVDVVRQPEGTLPDIQSTQYAINFLKNHSAHHNTRNKPFFLAAGYHKPHIPLKYPQKFLDMYPIEKIHVAPDPYRTYDMPPVAFEPWTDIRWRDDIAALNLSFPYGHMPDWYAKKIIQSYYAATSYVDSLIGDLLGALDDYGFGDNTIVSFIGDHGWALGEHLEWAKYSNFRVATNVPLMVHVPGLTDKRDPPSNTAQTGMVSNALVELVDLFPTLAELTGLKVPECQCPFPFKRKCEILIKFVHVQGRKKNLCTQRKYPCTSLDTYAGPSDMPQENSCEPTLSETTIMGYSMQTSQYRYTEWIQFDHNTQKGNWSNVHARELYLDQKEDRNVASLSEFSELVKQLSTQLKKGWRNALPVNQN